MIGEYTPGEPDAWTWPDAYGDDHEKRIVRVVNVKHSRTAAERARVCYCGRQFAGWPSSSWGNHSYLSCPGEFRNHLLHDLRAGELDRMLLALWLACDRGAKPLGCWCLDWDGQTYPMPRCHAAVWAELLNRRFVNLEGV